MTGPLEGGTLRPVAEGPRVSLHGVPCGRARLRRGGRDPPGPLVPCGLGGTWRAPVTCSKRPPKAAGPEGKARARMGVCSHSPGQVSLTPSPAGRPGSGAGRLRPWGWPAPRSRRMPGGDLVVAHRAVARPSAAAVSCPLPRSPRKPAWCRPSPSLLKDVLLPETGPLAGRCLPAHAPSLKASLGTTPVTHPRAHSHSSIHPHSVFCSGLSAGTHRGDQMNTPLARPLQGRGLRAAGGGDAAREPKRKWGHFLSTRLCLCGSCLKERTRPCVPRFPQAWARTGGWRVCAGECALASVL